MRHFNKDYVVDENGRLFSLKSGELKELKPYSSHNGYLMYRITMEGKTKHYSAHHLSYWCNVGPFDAKDGLQIDHIDGNKLNNHYSNLRRITPSENSRNINTSYKQNGRTPKNKKNIDLNEVYSLIKRGYSLREISVMLKCSKSTLRNYIKGYSIKGEISPHYTRKSLDKIDPTYGVSSYKSPGEIFKGIEPKKVVERVGSKAYYKYSPKNECVKCSEPTTGKLCLACYNAEKSSNIPSRETLEKELKTGKPIVYLSSLHGVSDNAYRKWLKKRELPYKYNEIKVFTSV